ncbi:unnamed protein product [Allacma fusca]|uniref:Uncharacterized protein n=1 Tax=Allacma fusca TaxID=39272 RepID=A0A8J2LHW3_9HEXA|nr:unnamed protein product [Allacma fusca]
MSSDRNPNEQLGVTVEKLRDAVFSNDVFWRLLAKYLNFGDLKVCRLVSSNFNRKVLEETNFKSRGAIRLTKNLLQPSGFGSTVEKWKNISIRIFVLSQVENEPLIDLTWFYSLLSDVEELYISADINFDETASFYPPLHKVLEAVKSLKKLSIDQQFLSQADVSTHLPYSKSVEDTLGNLTELELVAPHGRPMFATFPGKFGKWMDNLVQALKNVSTFRTDGIVPEDNSEFPEEVDEELHPKVQNLLRIIEGNQTHLTSVCLDDMQLWSTSCDRSLQSLSTKVFPRLSSVKIRMSQIETKNVISFLRQQCLLRDIDITVFNQFPVELLNVILERKELSRLCIKTKTFENFSSCLWKRITELNNLEVFALHLVNTYRFASNSELLPSCIVHLPPSVKKIYLKGVSPHTVWDPNDTVITRESFSNLNPALLTELCISKCGSCLNDDVLEFICRTFRFLRVLNISNTDHKCTDYGFIGRPVKSDVIPFCISNLLGLRHLTLRSCGVITDATLIHGIKFMELCYLDISNNARITQQGWRAVLAQNPSLEVLKTSELDPFESEEELKKLYPRLKEHKFSDGGDSDDDDASENHHYLGSDSDFSGGGYPGMDEPDIDDFGDDAYLDYDDDYDSDLGNEWH